MRRTGAGGVGEDGGSTRARRLIVRLTQQARCRWTAGRRRTTVPPMRYGFYLPTRGQSATPEALTALVERAETLGFHSVVIGDHVVFPVHIASKYPYTVSGAFPGGGDALEQLTLATFIAAHTQRLRLVTSVMILPHRHPVLAAKMLASIDVLSRGRLTVGVGVGWLREEFEALGAPDFDRRGSASDEILTIFKTLWSGAPSSFSGEFF